MLSFFDFYFNCFNECDTVQMNSLLSKICILLRERCNAGFVKRCVKSIPTSACPQSGDRFLLKMMAGAAVTRTEKSVRIGVRMARRSWCLLILNTDTYRIKLLAQLYVALNILFKTEKNYGPCGNLINIFI